MSDEQLDRLGDYFVYHKLRERYGWTFDYFLQRYLRGVYEI